MKETFNSYSTPAVSLNNAGRDSKYVETIIGRAKKATDELGITWTPLGQNVLNIIANRYFKLNDIYAERDSMKNTDKKLAEAQCDSKLYRSHFEFEANLSMYLNPQDIERVKDVMTFNVVKVTYEAQCDMIPTLKEEEKAQILIWLKEARELAIDAESSKKKHEVFGKYKGRINNYLTKYRIKMAMDYLKDVQVKVYEVAEKVGYQDIAYFSNTFKKLVGKTPSDYQTKGLE